MKRLQNRNGRRGQQPFQDDYHHLRGKNKTGTVTTYETDDFGKNGQRKHDSEKYQDGRWLPSYEEEVLLVYDENGNVSQTETKSRKEGDTDWQSRITKADYDDQGNITKNTVRAVWEENVAAAYTCDIFGRKIKKNFR